MIQTLTVLNRRLVSMSKSKGTLMVVHFAPLRRWRERRRRKAAIRELRAVDDRTLKDMGLTRGEIVAAADGEVYRGAPIRRAEPEPPEAPVAAFDPAELERHLDRARHARAEYLRTLCARALGGTFRRLRRALHRRWRLVGRAAPAARCAAASPACREER